jgi:hypothetical protein
VNYWGVRPGFRIYDYNGWEIEFKTLVDGRTSCPVCWVAPLGHRYRDRQHHPWWNGLIDCINHARSCAATGPILPVFRESPRARDKSYHDAPKPVVYEPHPTGGWFTEHLLAHLIRTGARRFMMFHPHAHPDDERLVARVVREHAPEAPEALPRLPEIPLDVDEIVTGGFRTTYADFLRQRPEEWIEKW